MLNLLEGAHAPMRSWIAQIWCMEAVGKRGNEDFGGGSQRQTQWGRKASKDRESETLWLKGHKIK